MARSSDLTIRRAKAADATALARLRVALLEETGGVLPEAERASMLRTNEAFFVEHMGSSAWSHWVAEDAGQLVSVGTLSFFLRPPYPGNPEGKDAYFLNMYTLAPWRRQGVARQVLLAAMAEARARGVRKLVLHATEAGRPMYAAAGFVPSAAYMELSLDAN